MSLKVQESSLNEWGLVHSGCQSDTLKALEEGLMMYSGWYQAKYLVPLGQYSASATPVFSQGKFFILTKDSCTCLDYSNHRYCQIFLSWSIRFFVCLFFFLYFFLTLSKPLVLNFKFRDRKYSLKKQTVVFIIIIFIFALKCHFDDQGLIIILMIS